MMRVVEVDPQTDPRWEAFVAAHPDGLVYHHPAWLQALHQEYDRRFVSLACEDADGQLRGVLPLCHTRGLPFRRGGQITGRRLSSLPRTPVAGPLALDEQAATALVQAAVERVRPGTRLELKLWTTGLDGLVDGVAHLPWRQTYVLELPRRPADLRFGNSRNHSRIKWAVNKAVKMGVQVRSAETEDDLQAWYAIYLETVRWHAMPARQYRFFKACWELLRPGGLMRLLLAEHDEAGRRRLLAGSIILMFGQTVFYAFNGRRREDLSLRPNDAIQWQAIHDARCAGFRYYDFGDVTEDDQGLAAFKSKWGAEPRRLYRSYYPAPGKVEADPLKSDDHTRQLVNKLWQRLPLSASTVLGDWFYRYL